MSKALKEANQVYSFLQKSLENQRTQGEAMQMILNRMMEVETNVNETAAEIKVLARQIKDENRLLPAEIDDLYRAVVDKSIELAKIRHHEEDENFSRIVGRYRKNIWSKLKKKFATSKYIHIRRVDYDPALEFVNTFDPEDYL